MHVYGSSEDEGLYGPCVIANKIKIVAKDKVENSCKNIEGELMKDMNVVGSDLYYVLYVGYIVSFLQKDATKVKTMKVKMA